MSEQNQHPLEDRLRRAFEARTAEVTERDLTHSFEDVVGESRQQRPRWVAPLAAAAAIAVLAGGIGWATSHENRPTPATTDPPTVTAPTSTAPTNTLPSTTMPPSTPPETSTSSQTSTPVETRVDVSKATPREEPRSAIPWEEVGPGWAYVMWSGPDELLLYLVNTRGVRYRIADLSRGTYNLVDVAPDNRRVLIWSGAGGGYRELDAVTGTSKAVDVAPGVGSLRYSKPNGDVMLGERETGTSRYEAVRLDDDGNVAQVFGDFGSLPPSWSSSPDGMTHVVRTESGIQLIGNAKGTVIRTLVLPEGVEASSCHLRSWWSTDEVQAVCGHLATSAVWALSTSGGDPRLLAGPRPGGDSHTGTVFQTARGDLGHVVHEPQEGGCGRTSAAWLNQDGTSGARVDLGIHGRLRRLAVVDDLAFTLDVLDCDTFSSALRVTDLVSGETSPALLGAGVNGGSISGIIAVP